VIVFVIYTSREIKRVSLEGRGLGEYWLSFLYWRRWQKQWWPRIVLPNVYTVLCCMM